MNTYEKGKQMFGKLIELVTLPVDMAKDILTLGGELTDGESATMKKLDSLSGKKEREREQNRKDLETIAKIIKELRKDKL